MLPFLAKKFALLCLTRTIRNVIAALIKNTLNAERLMKCKITKSIRPLGILSTLR